MKIETTRLAVRALIASAAALGFIIGLVVSLHVGITHAQEPLPPTIKWAESNSVYLFNVSPQNYLSIGGEEVVKINLQTGEITYGKNYKPDAAAEIFWKALAANYPCRTEK